MSEVKYAWCGYWDGICKAVIADIPDREDMTGQVVLQWLKQGVEAIRRAPIDIAREELRL